MRNSADAPGGAVKPKRSVATATSSGLACDGLCYQCANAEGDASKPESLRLTQMRFPLADYLTALQFGTGVCLRFAAAGGPI